MASTTFNGSAAPELTPEQELREFDLRDLRLETVAVFILVGVGVVGVIALLSLGQEVKGRTEVHTIAHIVLLATPLVHILLVAWYAYSIYFDPSGYGKEKLPERYRTSLMWRGMFTSGIVVGTIVAANIPGVFQWYLWPILPAAILLAWASRRSLV